MITIKTRVFMSGGSQAVVIPPEYRFNGSEVYIRRDPQSGNLILSQGPSGWQDIYAALDNAGFTDDFLSDRAQGPAQERQGF